MKTAPITSRHQEYGAFADSYLVTKRSTMIGAIELAGRDPDGLSVYDYQGLSLIARDIYQNLSDEINITQYYIHFDEIALALRRREHPVSDLLSKRREGFLNGQPLSGSRLVVFFEVRCNSELFSLGGLNFLEQLVRYPFDRSVRPLVKARLSPEHMIVATLDELQRQKSELDSSLEEVSLKWRSVIPARILSLQDIWAYLRFLSNLDPSLLELGLHEDVPLEQWDLLLSQGDCDQVEANGLHCLKFYGDQPVYARIASVKRFGESATYPGIWASDADSPMRLPHNLVAMMRFMPLTPLQKTWMFQSKENELARQSLSLRSMFRGEESLSPDKKRALMKESIARKVKELEEAEVVDDRWGYGCSHVLLFEKDPNQLRVNCTRLKKSMNQSGMSLVFESAGMADAYQSFLPGGSGKNIRSLSMTTTQIGAASLLYQSSEGQRIVDDLNHEESQYIFLSPDGTLFHYSPWVDGRALVIGVGRIRSGKSFTKATVATHFQKYGGFYRAIDIDPGSEPVADCFGADGAIFRIEDDASQGFNPFHVAGGPNDQRFVTHFKQQVIKMLQTNDAEDLRHLDASEQRQLDRAIESVLDLPRRLQRFSTFARHCSQELQFKLERFYGEGMYAPLFDQEDDPMGSLDIPVAAFNLAGIKDDPVLLPLAMQEIFYRVTRLFESEEFRPIPKFLDFDEAHVHLKDPKNTQQILRNIRTWGKHLAGIGLWTQSPNDFFDLPDWDLLRASASTFFFMADPAMDEDQYQNKFKLSTGECEAIRNLIPQREAYIIQRDLAVSKRVILTVEPEQYVISTSKPREVALRQKNVKNFPNDFAAAVDRTVEDLGLNDSNHDGPNRSKTKIRAIA